MACGFSISRVALLASTSISFVVAMSGHLQAQTLLDQYIPSGNTSLPEFYRGGGNTLPSDTTNGRDTASGITVASRVHPEYDALGMRIYNILFNASLTEGFGYDSNPLGLTKAKGSSFLLTQGAFSAATNWNRNGANIFAQISDYRYFDVPRVSHTDYTVGVGGYLDIGRDKLQVNYTHFNLNILPTGIDTVGVNNNNEVTPFTIDRFNTNYTTRFGRFTVIPEATYSIYRFGANDANVNLGNTFFNTPGIGATSTSLFNTGSVNNRDEIGGGVTVKYELSPGRDVVGVVRSVSAQFKSNALAQLSRDYTSYEGLAGIDFQASGKLRYRVLAGYQHRSYNKSGTVANKSTTAPIFEAQVIWMPTGLTTVTLTGNRRIEDSVSAGLNNFTYTTGRVQVDHELKRNVILSAFGQVQFADYGENRSARVYNVGTKATWKLNRRVALVGSYEYLKRTSNTFNNYDEHLVLAQVKFSL